ncbi:MICOS complex subunit MIC13 isoform X3 [Falco cherrug]|uniref:MICOS complex subunit MIC13 isoform X3 n=1 Tax=Falco cherrug TaxID=345164 RepID=UPI0024793D3D|nr:MICOS complex subunit MIC13 isoform X3 [Falco cherrug]
MAARLVPAVKFVIKGGLAGAAVYVAYDQGLLGSSTQGAEALKKAQAALPPAIQEWTSYIGWEDGFCAYLQAFSENTFSLNVPGAQLMSCCAGSIPCHLS